MPIYRTIAAMQPLNGERITFDSGDRETFDASLDAIQRQTAAHFGFSYDDALDFLADMEMHGKLDEKHFKNGVEMIGVDFDKLN